MVPIAWLWLPILLSAVFVFVASSIIHMVLPYHKGDYRKMPAEDDVMEALRKFNIPPGDYMMPCAGGSQEMKSPAFAEKLKKGPVMIATVMPNGRFSMSVEGTAGLDYTLEGSSNFVQWFEVTRTNAGTSLFWLVDTNPPPTSRYYRVRQP